jgi:hypothetical protein
MEKSFKFEVTNQELQILGAGLGKLPYADVVNLMVKLNQQVAEQEKEPELTLVK